MNETMNIKIGEKIYVRFIFTYVLKFYYINNYFINGKSIPQKNS